MKKLSLFLLVLLLAGLLISCNGDGTETTDPDDTTVETMEETEPETEKEAPETEPPVGTYLVDSKYHTDAYIVANYNVLNYGAVGDGVTDDTAAVKAAIAEASAEGGNVFLPEGHYAIYEPIELPKGVTLVGELEEGTANGTVLYVYCGKNAPEDPAFLRMFWGSGARNLAIYYPEQTFVDGAPIPYPYTFEQTFSEGIYIENITLVNAYNGFDLASDRDALQTIRNVYGTVLNTGLWSDESLDIGRFENIHFSPAYWLTYGGENTPAEEELRSYMLDHSVGIILERIDWTYFADIFMEGYNTGVLIRASDWGACHGHMYNFNLLDCRTPLYVKEMAPYGFLLSNCTFRAVGEDSVAILVGPTFGTNISLMNCTVESEGKYAIHNQGVGLISGVDTTVTAAETPYFTEKGTVSFINSQIEGVDVTRADLPTLRTDVDYGTLRKTKPASTAFVNMGEAPYSIQNEEDITERLQVAIDSLKETGGMVYIPSGFYYVEGAITVHAGIELRSCLDIHHNYNTHDGTGASIGATIRTHFGENDPDGEALFNLMDGAGMRGFTIQYPDQFKDGRIVPYSYTVRGNGSGIYVCNLFIQNPYNGIDFASHRCDDHYVESLRGCVLNVGIAVGGGSENGVIRDVHYTPNVVSYAWDLAFNHLSDNGTPFLIGDSKNEVLLHNFSFGGYKGICITEGAEDFYSIANGVDASRCGVYLEGSASGQFVNTQLVAGGNSMLDKSYVISDENFTGDVKLMNTATWGYPSRNCVIHNGTGKLTMIGGRIGNDCFTLFDINGGSTLIAGIQESNMISGFDLDVDPAVDSVTLVGNVFNGGLRYRARKVEESKLIGFN